MVPKLWVERINAVIPDLGFHVRWHGLWMEVAEGRCSLRRYMYRYQLQWMIILQKEPSPL